MFTANITVSYFRMRNNLQYCQFAGAMLAFLLSGCAGTIFPYDEAREVWLG